MRFRSSILLPVAALVLAACGGSDSSSNNPTSPSNPSNPSNPVTPTMTNQVTVSDNTFTPSSIQVAVNTGVIWTWSSAAATHNVTMADGTGSGDKSAGETFTKSFPTAGTFTYHCTIHPGMNGTILVQ